MTALLLLFIAALLGAIIGRFVLDCLRTVPENLTERVTMSTAIGLGVVAYIILAVGLVGWLKVQPTITALLFAGAISFRGIRLLAEDFRNRKTAPANEVSGDARTTQNSSTVGARWIKFLSTIVLIAIAVITVINCYVPPGAHEWDALAYHLAAPKVYLQNHQIVFLPTDHHSNFPFLVQMLFTLGLMLDGYPLANLFHLAMGALTVASLVCIGRRHFSLSTGWIAAVAFATTPIAVWEAGAAYIEHGMALYVLLAVGATLEFRRTKNANWLALAGIFMGFALSTKALALIPAFVLIALLLLNRVPFRVLRLYVLAIVLVGSPFYIKSWVWTGDPVYPFGYKIFGGKYWSDDLAQAYSGTQTAFGLRGSNIAPWDDARNIQPGPEPPSPIQRLRNVFTAPFALISVPRVFYDYSDPGQFTQLGFLFLTLPALLLVAPSEQGRFSDRGRSNDVSFIGALTVAWFVVWSQTMQYVRYLVPLLPLTALLGGEGAVRAIRMSRLLVCACTAAIFLQVYLTLTYFGSRLPDRAAIATDSVARQKYLERTVNHYRSIEWINANAPQNAGVVLFEETRGFYLDRPYLWGNYFHSRYIPYEQFRTAHDMVDWFLSHGIRYAMVNLQFSPIVNSSAENRDRMREAARSNSEAGVMLEWYGPNAAGGEKWRPFLGQALVDGDAVLLDEPSRAGVVVLEFKDRRIVPLDTRGAPRAGEQQ